MFGKAYLCVAGCALAGVLIALGAVRSQPQKAQTPPGADEERAATARSLGFTEQLLARKIDEAVAAYPGPREFFVQRVAEGVGTIAAAFHPKPVIVRMSDFKSNEYANLVGGPSYEPHEENPMLGYRGASRYLSPDFADCFAMEAEALKYVRDTMGLTNVKVMIPFVEEIVTEIDLEEQRVVITPPPGLIDESEAVVASARDAEEDGTEAGGQKGGA